MTAYLDVLEMGDELVPVVTALFASATLLPFLLRLPSGSTEVSFFVIFDFI